MSLRQTSVLLSLLLCGAVGSAAAQDFDNLVPGASSAGTPRQSPPPPSAGRPAAAPAPRRVAPAAVAVTRPPASQTPVTLIATLDRTAVWVGERFTYTVKAICPAGTDVLAADISRDRLRPTGLEIADATQTRTVGDDGTISYESRFTLVSYVTDGSRVALEPQPVRYYVHTAGQAADTLVPADEIALAPLTVAVRSTLPDANVMWLRDTRPVATLPGLLDNLVPAGLALGGVSLIPVVIGVAGMARVHRPRRTSRDTKSASHYRARLDELRRADVIADPAQRQQAYAAISAVIRERLTDLEIPALGLTAEELEPVLRERAPRLAQGDLVSVLRACERALYGGPDHLPPTADVAPAIDQAAQLLTAKAR